MATREIHSHIKAVQHLAAAAYTTTQTPSNGVDLRGFEAADFLIAIGTVTNIANSPQPSWAFKLQDSDSQSSGFADVTDSDYVLVGSAASPVAAPSSRKLRSICVPVGATAKLAGSSISGAPPYMYSGASSAAPMFCSSSMVT